MEVAGPLGTPLGLAQRKRASMDKTIIQKDTCLSVLIGALITMAKTWKQAKCPLAGEWETIVI